MSLGLHLFVFKVGGGFSSSLKLGVGCNNNFMKEILPRLNEAMQIKCYQSLGVAVIKSSSISCDGQGSRYSGGGGGGKEIFEEEMRDGTQ